MDLSEFVGIFLEEAREHLEESERLLLSLDEAAPDTESVNALFRAMHSIKGGAATFGMPELSALAHVLETLLDRVRTRRLTLTSAHIELLLRAKDLLRSMLGAHGAGQPHDAAAAQAIEAELSSVTNALGDSAAAAAPAPPTQPRRPDGVTGEGVGERTHARGESATIRVAVEKVDHLINMVGELVITQAMLEQLAGALDTTQHQRLVDSVGVLVRNTRDLQAAAMGVRMLPMEVVFSRFPRMLHDLMAKLGKKVELVTIGANTELDKSLTERLIDPLMHLIRNGVDHGIEAPAVRLAAGKREVGRLTLSAQHQSGGMVIEVSDDGAGLHRDRILAKARQQGLAVRDDIADEDVWALIFAPGFSTADVVSDVSGRGVGMDVVKRNIMAMGGSVEVRSSSGVGTTTRITLPLTLAMLDGMTVRIGEEIYVIAMSQIIESLRLRDGQAKRVLGQRDLLSVRSEYIPLVSLKSMFDAADVPPAEPMAERPLVVVVECEGKKAAIVVDDLLGQQQVVVKSLESNFRRVGGFSGATILGNGRVALILDARLLVQRAHAQVTEAAGARRQVAARAE